MFSALISAAGESLTVALEVLKQCPGEKWLALGAFGELGADSESIHSEMGREIKKAGVQRLFATGSMAENTVQAFGTGADYYAAQDVLALCPRQDRRH
jgi:UDP-N-acetylmuramoyl-tripeptide--D-alanyl-D-alanine ligase